MHEKVVSIRDFIRRIPRRFPSRLQQAWETFVYYVKEVAGRFANESVFIWTAAISFKVLVALFPLVMLIVGVFGLVVDQDAVFRTLEEFMNSLTPEYVVDQDAFGGLWRAFADLGGTVTIISAVALFITVVSMLSTLRAVITRIFREHHEGRSIIRGYASDLRLALQGGLFFLLTLVLIVAFTSNEVLSFFYLGKESWLIRGAFLLLPFLITTTLFMQLYYFIPRPRPHPHSALVGAVTAGVFWEVAKNAFTLYASRSTTFELYARVEFLDGSMEEAGRAVMGDFISMGLVLLFWVYYSGLVIIVGAMVAAITNQRMTEQAIAHLKKVPLPEDEEAPSLPAETEPSAEVGASGDDEGALVTEMPEAARPVPVERDAER